MSRRPARALALWLVVALVVLAGCNGVFGSDDGGSGETPDPDLTPAPVPNETDVATPTPDADALPPGVRPGRITSVSELRRAHESVVTDSVTVTNRVEVEGETSGQSITRTYVRNRSTYLQTVGESAVAVVYADPTGKYSRGFDVEAGAPTNVSDDVSVSGPRQDAPLAAGFSVLTAGSADIERVERDGTEYFRIHTTRRTSDRSGHADVVSVTAYARPDGFVRTIVESREDRHRNGTTHTERRVTYRNVGNTTVTEPEWVRAEKSRLGLVDLPPATPAEGAPPGIGEERLYNVSALWDAHRSVLENRSFTRAQTLETPDGDLNRSQRLVLENRTSYARSIGDRTVYYVDPTGTYFRSRTDDGPGQVDVFPSPMSYDSEPAPAYLMEFGSAVTPVERDGTAYFRVDFRVPPPNLSVETRNYNATALVRDDGLVERITADMTVRQSVVGVPPNGSAEATREWIDVREEIVYRDVGNTTVTEPAWVTRAKRNGSGEDTGGTPTPTDSLDGTDSPSPAAVASGLESAAATRS